MYLNTMAKQPRQFVIYKLILIALFLAASIKSNPQHQNLSPGFHSPILNKTITSIVSLTNGNHVYTSYSLPGRSNYSVSHGVRYGSGGGNIVPGIQTNGGSNVNSVTPIAWENSNNERTNPTLTNITPKWDITPERTTRAIGGKNVIQNSRETIQNDTIESPKYNKVSPRTNPPKIHHPHTNHPTTTHHTNHETEVGTNYKEREPNSPRILTDSTDGPLTSSLNNRNNLCTICLCSGNQSIITCSPSNPIYEKLNISGENFLRNQILELTIKGYSEVYVSANTFAQKSSQLKLVKFENINKLVLVEHSFLFPSEAKLNSELNLHIRNSNIPKLPKYGLTQSIHEHNQRQTKIQLERTRFISVQLYNCVIGEIEEYAIAEARVLNFNITNSKINKMNKKSIDLDVYEVCTIHGNDLPALVSEAICLHAKKTVISSNMMEEIANHSIMIETDSQVSFRSNYVKNLRAGALSGIRPMEDVDGANIVFLMNEIEISEPSSLYIDTSFPVHEIKVLNNSFHLKCECNISATFKSLMDTKSSSYDTLSYKNVLKSSRCLEPMTDLFVNIEQFLTDECAPFPIATVSSVIVAIILFIIAVTVCVVCSLRVQHAKEEVNMLGECTSQSFSTLSRMNNEHPDILQYSDGQQHPLFAVLPWMNAVPEFKTYQQSQITDLTEVTESICGESTLGSMSGARTNERRNSELERT